MSRRPPGERGQRVGVEAELEDVAGFPIGAGQFGVDGLIPAVTVGRVFDPDQKVCDAADAVVEQGHLVDDVRTRIQWVADASHPGCERLADQPFRNLVDGSTFAAESRQAIGLVLDALVDEKPGERAEGGPRRPPATGFDLTSECQEVVAVQPGRDLGGAEKAFAHHCRQIGAGGMTERIGPTIYRRDARWAPAGVAKLEGRTSTETHFLPSGELQQWSRKKHSKFLPTGAPAALRVGFELLNDDPALI